MRVTVRPIGPPDAADPELLDQLAALLAERHRRHRVASPLLDPSWETPASCRPHVVDLLAAPDASGAVAVDGGRVVGYLLGRPLDDAVWGPNVWLELAGAASLDPESARDLYAVAAQGWVDAGRTAHYVLVPAHDAGLVDAFFRLGFGLQHVHAIRAPAPAGPAPDGVLVRAARPADVPVLARLDLELPRHQGRSPVFSSGPMSSEEESVAEWEQDVEDERFATFVAELDGEVVGSAVGCDLAMSSLHAGPARADRAGFLGFAAVLPAARGRGAGRALGEAVIDWSARSGHRSVVTDWRGTNLLSSRTWPRLGFEPTFVRLHRITGR